MPHTHSPHPSVLTLTGASGVGKTTLLRRLLADLPGAHMLTSVTTREQRESDVPGEYEYVSPEEFDEREAAGEFLWTAEVHAARYGTATTAVQSALAQPPWSIMVLTPERLLTLNRFAPQGLVALHLISPGEPELRRRLLGRGDDPASVEYRVAECRDWDARVVASGVPVITVTSETDRDQLIATIQSQAGQ